MNKYNLRKVPDGVWRVSPLAEVRFPDYDYKLTTQEHQKVDRFIEAHGLKNSTRPAIARRRTPRTKGGERQ